jgi:hypothetical protein
VETQAAEIAILKEERDQHLKGKEKVVDDDPNQAHAQQ